MKKRNKKLIISFISIIVVGTAGIIAWYFFTQQTEQPQLTDKPLYGPGERVGPCDTKKNCYDAVKNILPDLQEVVDMKRGKAETYGSSYGHLLKGNIIHNLQAFQDKGWFNDTGSDRYPSLGQYPGRLRLDSIIVKRDANKKEGAFSGDCVKDDVLSLEYYYDLPPENQRQGVKLYDTDWYLQVLGTNSKGAGCFEH